MIKEALFLVFIGLGIGYAWHKVWVEPQDEYRMKILSCMDGDRSRAAYDRCVIEIGEME